MPVRLGRFEMPKSLTKEEFTATETYVKFFAEPFEAGYGHTVGNSLRRVLLSSLEGAAITSVRITGTQHEFASLPGVVEDVTPQRELAGQPVDVWAEADALYGAGHAHSRAATDDIHPTSSTSAWYALAWASWMRGMCSERVITTWSANPSDPTRPPS